MNSLESHNNLILGHYNSMNEPRKNGIACPDCEEELWDSNPNMCLTSHPPQYQIHCDCGYRGTRY